MRSAPPVPTLAEMAESCAHNAHIAKGHLDRALQVRAAAGPPGLDSDNPNPNWEAANNTVSRHQGEFLHWSQYASYYRSRAALEGGNTVPAVLAPLSRNVAPAPRRPTDPLPPPAADRRLPPEREAGADDDEPLPREFVQPG